MSEIYDLESFDIQEEMEPNWQPKVYAAFVLGGALIGLAAAYVFIQNAEDDNEAPGFTAGKGLKIGLLVLGLVRNVADLAR